MTDRATLLAQRPLSPHLQIYKPQTSTVISIFHRISGGALNVGALLLSAWLWTAAYEPSWHDVLREHLTAWYGLAALVGWSAAFYWHLAAGVRHLVWDTGHGFAVPTMNKTAWLVVWFTLFATAGTWTYVFDRMGVIHVAG